MLRALTKENCNVYKMNETRNNYSLQKKSSEKSEVFYLATDTYYITGRIPEHVLLALCSAFSSVWTEGRGPGQDPCRPV
jgi:hypothetical protein